MNPLTFKNATLKTDDETSEGVLIISNDTSSTIPKKIFVPYNEKVFYTNEDVYLHENILVKCKSNMLELLSYLELYVPFIDDYFFDENSGFVVNFYQPNQSYQGHSVYVQLIDPIEWLQNWDMSNTDKNKWINAMINKNPPEIIKNKLLLVNL